MMAARSDSAGPDDERAISAADIERALAAGEIVPWFQPIRDLSANRMSGVEALARWEQPSRPVRTPDDFLPVAEQSEVIFTLDRAIIAHALADLRHWQSVQPNFRLSVNLSARHFASTDVIDQVYDLAVGANVSPTTVDIEITETIPPSDAKRAKFVTARFRELGFRIWLDDFGTGWNSIGQLFNLAVDGLKIDRSFAAAMETPVGWVVTESIARLAKSLGLLLTIEGVETRGQADLAVRLGCDYAQGYLWSPAVPGREIRPEHAGAG